MRKSKTSDKGNVSELKVMMAYVEAGFAVSVPFGGGAPYDLIVDTGKKLLKVQVKTGRLRDGCVLFSMRRFNGRGGKGHRYDCDELDVFAVYCPDNNQIYVTPFTEGLNEGRLRCGKTKNNQQQQKVRWAEQFEFGSYLESLKG